MGDIYTQVHCEQGSGGGYTHKFIVSRAVGADTQSSCVGNLALTLYINGMWRHDLWVET